MSDNKKQVSGRGLGCGERRVILCSSALTSVTRTKPATLVMISCSGTEVKETARRWLRSSLEAVAAFTLTGTS